MGGGGGFRGAAIGGGACALDSVAASAARRSVAASVVAGYAPPRSAPASVAGFGFPGPVVSTGVRVAGFHGGGWGWCRGWGWSFPFAGLAFAATAGYYGSCWRWDGFEWGQYLLSAVLRIRALFLRWVLELLVSTFPFRAMRPFSAATVNDGAVRARRLTKPVGLRLRNALGMNQLSDAPTAAASEGSDCQYLRGTLGDTGAPTSRA